MIHLQHDLENFIGKSFKSEQHVRLDNYTDKYQNRLLSVSGEQAQRLREKKQHDLQSSKDNFLPPGRDLDMVVVVASDFFNGLHFDLSSSGNAAMMFSHEKTLGNLSRSMLTFSRARNTWKMVQAISQLYSLGLDVQTLLQEPRAQQSMQA